MENILFDINLVIELHNRSCKLFLQETSKDPLKGNRDRLHKIALQNILIIPPLCFDSIIEVINVILPLRYNNIYRNFILPINGDHIFQSLYFILIRKVEQLENAFFIQQRTSFLRNHINQWNFHFGIQRDISSIPNHYQIINDPESCLTNWFHPFFPIKRKDFVKICPRNTDNT